MYISMVHRLMAGVPVGVNNELSIANEQMRNVKTLFHISNMKILCGNLFFPSHQYLQYLKTKHETDTIQRSLQNAYILLMRIKDAHLHSQVHTRLKCLVASKIKTNSSLQRTKNKIFSQSKQNETKIQEFLCIRNFQNVVHAHLTIK